ncbi:MAG: hypothetical protein JSU98_12060 [Gemmatimonadales bacterium]|jgi:hypothetical protein|nr:MAG: hypothetical protein JSU98_12060 [Gemmatimonadales bacterium]
MDDQDQRQEEDERGPIGIFPNWAAVYWSVVIYTAVLIAVLWIFTVVLNYSVR